MSPLVAVTGATGFVGSEVVRALSGSGFRVRVLARNMPSAALSPGTCLNVTLGSLDDLKALRALVAGVDLVIHVAGIVKARRPADFFAVNEIGTRNVLTALQAENPTARLIHISSIAAREPQLSPYAASKHAAEVAVESLAGGRPHVILRPPAVYGPRDLEILPLFQAASRGICPYPASPNARLSLIHVRDLATAVTNLASTPAWPQTRYEVSDGSEYLWPSIVSALAHAVGRPVTGMRIPRAVLFPIAIVDRAVQCLTRSIRVLSPAKLPELYHPDWTVKGPTLQRDIGFRPLFTLTAGFEDTVTWYRQFGLVR